MTDPSTDQPRDHRAICGAPHPTNIAIRPCCQTPGHRGDHFICSQCSRNEPQQWPRVDADTPKPDLERMRRQLRRGGGIAHSEQLALIAEVERLQALDAQRIADCERLMDVAELLRAQRQAALDLCEKPWMLTPSGVRAALGVTE